MLSNNSTVMLLFQEVEKRISVSKAQETVSFGENCGRSAKIIRSPSQDADENTVATELNQSWFQIAEKLTIGGGFDVFYSYH